MGVLRPGNYGNGRVVDMGGAYVFIPNNLDKNATATIINPGQGSFYTMCNNLYNPVIKKNCDQIVVIPKYDGYMYGEQAMQNAYNRSMKYINQICNENGSTLVAVNTLGSSAGDRYSLKEFSNACRDGIDNGYCVITGASTISGANQAGQKYNYGPNWAFLTDEEYSHMKGRTVYVFEGKAAEKYSYVQALVKHGVNVVLVECKSSGHDALSWNPLNTNIFDLLEGNPDGFLADNNYSFWRCVDEEGKTWVNMSDEEVREASSSNFLEVLVNKYDNLADLADHYRSTGDTLASNLVVVSNSMNELKGKITEHQDLNYTKESDNEASIIGAMYNATNYYGTVTNLLYGNISAEADAVYGIANAIYQMDGFASVMADSTLSDGMSSLYSTSNPAVAEQLNKLKAASAGLLDTARSAVMANGRYDELTNILGTKAEAGHVGKISISSLESAINSIVPVLNNEVEVATGLNASVTDFMSNIGASNVLQGGVWEDVKTNMANYQNLLDANVKASEFLTDTVKTAMGIVTDYIQGAGSKISAVGALADYGNLATVGELDDSKLPELTAALTEMQTKIDETDAKVKELEASRHMVDDGYTDEKTGEFVKTGEHQEPPESEIQPYRDQLENYKQIKETLDAYREVLEGFAPVVQAAQDIINDAVNQVKNMYENPVQDTDGNITFNTDFKLDLSPYSDYIDVAKDYKGLINDYYDKMNPQKSIDEALELDSQEDDPTGSVDPDDDGYDGGGGGGGGGGPISGPDTPTVPTDPATEPEVKTEVKTEAKTEVQTEVHTEVEQPTDVTTQPEQKTEPTIVTLVEEDEPTSGGGGGHRPTPLTTEEEPIIQDTQETILDPVVEEPMIDEYMEQPFTKPEDIPQEIVETPAVVKNSDNSLKTMGIAGGIGIVLGSAALGAHTILKNKDEEESDNDYGYDK